MILSIKLSGRVGSTGAELGHEFNLGQEVVEGPGTVSRVLDTVHSKQVFVLHQQHARVRHPGAQLTLMGRWRHKERDGEHRCRDRRQQRQGWHSFPRLSRTSA